MFRGSACQSRGVVLVYTVYPKLLACFGIERIKPTNLVAEQQRIACPVRHRKNSGANRPVRLKGPIHAACLRIEGLHNPARATHKKSALHHRRLSKRSHIVSKPKRPFQLEAGDLPDSESSLIRGLITRIISTWTPPVPSANGRTCE